MRFRRGHYLALILTLVAIGLLLWTLAEARRQRRAIERALASQALVLAGALGPGMAAASHAARELDEIVLWKLLDNARMFAALGPPEESDSIDRSELVEANGLDAVVWIDREGRARAAIGETITDDLGAELGPLLRGSADELVLGSSRDDDREYVGAAVASADGGAVLVSIRNLDARAFARQLGVENLLSSLVGTGGVLYLGYQEEPTGRRTAVTWDDGPIPERPSVGSEIREVRGRGAFEVEVPLQAPAGSRSSLRVGLDAAPLRAAATAATRRTVLVGMVLLVLAAVAASLAVVTRLRYRDRVAAQQRLADVKAAQRRSERLAAAGALTAGLAHEVRSPMNAIGLAAQRLERKLPPGDERREIAGQIRGDLHRVEETLTQFLELASPVSEKRSAEQLRRTVEEVLQMLEPESEKAGVRLTDEGGEGVARVDGGSIRRALVNLVRNAVQASPRGAEVKVRLEQDFDTVRVVVSDRGQGVDPEIRDKVFDAFVTGRAEGTGLGLALVRRVAEEHGGGVRLVARSGGGTDAVLWLPRERRDEA